MKLKTHIISSIFLGLCSAFVVDMALHVLLDDSNVVIEYSHSDRDKHASIPELIEENVFQEYIAPNRVIDKYSSQINVKAVHNRLEESLYEQNISVPPPDFS